MTKHDKAATESETGRRLTNEEIIDLGLSFLGRLGRALFEKQERMLPEGETWDELDENERIFWRESAKALLHELKAIALSEAEVAE